MKPMPGSRRSRPKLSVEVLAVMALLLSGAGDILAPYEVVGDTIATPLDGMVGDAVRGRAIVAARQVSTCLLCHAGPFPEAGFQGDIGPSLTGVGDRLSRGQIRLRVVNAAVVNPETVMPSFYRTTGLVRVGRQWEGCPLLDAQQIEDVVAFLATSRAP